MDKKEDEQEEEEHGKEQKEEKEEEHGKEQEEEIQEEEESEEEEEDIKINFQKVIRNILISPFKVSVKLQNLNIESMYVNSRHLIIYYNFRAFSTKDIEKNFKR